MALQTRQVSYSSGDTQMDAFMVFDDSLSGPRPAVAIAHAWGGRSEFEEDKARWMAEQGYVGFALDVYGVGIRGSSPEENEALMMPLVNDRALLQQRLLAGIDALRAQSEVDETRIGAVGFCFGGLSVLDIARTGADVRGVVSTHGLFMPADNLSNIAITAKVLCLHGYDDPMVPPQAMTDLGSELSAAGADWQIHAFGNTVHAFTNPQANSPEDGMMYSPSADRRARVITEDFLQEVLA